MSQEGATAGALAEAKPSFCEAMRADEEGGQKAVKALAASMPAVVDRAQTLLLYWEKKYKHLWDQDRDAFMRCEPPDRSSIGCLLFQSKIVCSALTVTVLYMSLSRAQHGTSSDTAICTIKPPQL